MLLLAGIDPRNNTQLKMSLAHGLNSSVTSTQSPTTVNSTVEGPGQKEGGGAITGVVGSLVSRSQTLKFHMIVSLHETLELQVFCVNFLAELMAFRANLIRNL